nr:MAG: DNA pilot protein [Microvirus Sku117]
MGFLGSVVGAVGSLAGSVLGHKADKDAQKHQDARDDNKYQRTVADLEKAGLNKVLAVQGMSPSGGQDVRKNPGPGQAIADFSREYSAQSVARDKLEAEKKNIQADTDLKRQESLNKEKETIGKELDNQLKVLGKDTERIKQKLLATQNLHELKKIVNTEQQLRNLSEQEKSAIIDNARKSWELDMAKRDPANSLHEQIERYKNMVATRNLDYKTKVVTREKLLEEINKLVNEGRITEAEAKSWKNTIFGKNAGTVWSGIMDAAKIIK